MTLPYSLSGCPIRTQLHRDSTLLVVLAVFAVAPFLSSAAGPTARDFDVTIRPFLQEHCAKCHGEKKPKGKLRLDVLDASHMAGDDGAKWQAVYEKLILGEMPPEPAAQTRMLKEFGCDSSMNPPATGDFAKRQSSSEEQQAMWSVRSFLLLARLGVDHAHLAFFNDSDEAKLHGSRGITQNFEPKPAFHALAWLQRSLGEYRFARVEREDTEECHAFEFTHGTQPAKRAWVVWRSSGGPRVVRLFNDPWRVVRAERMPLIAGDAEKVDVRQEIEGYMAVEASECPVIVWLEK